MQVLYISTSRIPSRTANSIQVLKMAEAFLEAGQEVELLAPRLTTAGELGEERLRDHYGVNRLPKITWLPSSRPGSLRLYDMLAALHAARAQPDLVYSRPLVAAAATAFLGMRTIWEAHRLPMGSAEGIAMSVLLRSVGLRHLVVISEALKTRVLERYGDRIDGHDIVVAPDGVDLQRFSRLPSKEAERRHLGIDPLAPVAGYAGHLYPGRGVDLILQLAAELPRVLFLVMGGEPDAVMALKHRVQDRNLRNVTAYGFVPNSRLPHYLSACDFLLMPYERQLSVAGEGSLNTAEWMSPLKMFEYMAAGRPIVTSDLPVLREILAPDTAIFCSPGDLPAWKSALLQLARDPHRRQRMGEQGRSHVQQFTWRRRASNVLHPLIQPRVCMITSLFYPQIGGAERQAHLLARHLAKKGVEVAVLTRRSAAQPANETMDGFPVHRVWAAAPFRGPLSTVAFVASAVRWLGSSGRRFNILHCHQPASPSTIGIAAKLLYRKPVLIKVNTTGPRGNLATLANLPLFRLRRFILQQADAVVAVNAELAKDMAAFGLGTLPLARIPNGVDTELFCPKSPHERLELRTRLGLPAGAVIALYLGRLVEKKRVDLLLRSWKRLTGHVELPAELLIAGSGPAEPLLRRLASELGITDSVRFLGARNDVHTLLQVSDLMVLPSVAEGMSNALLEAMSCGVPVAAVDIDANRDLIQHEENGLLVPPDDDHALANALQRLVVLGDLRRSLGLAARQHILSRHAIDLVAERHLELYQQLLARSASLSIADKSGAATG